MKKIIPLILVLSLAVLPLFGTSASAQQQTACLQGYYKDGLVKNGVNQYYVNTVTNKKTYFWISPQAYLNTEQFEYGTWNCETAGNNLTFAKTGTLPDCVKTLKSLVTTVDPDAYIFNSALLKSDVSLWISKKQYQIRNTGQTGSWDCQADGAILLHDAKVPPKDTAGDSLPPVKTGDSLPNTNCAPNCASDSLASQSTDLPLRIKLNNPLKVDTIQDAIKVFMDAVIKIAIPFIVVFFIWSGLQFILAQGNTAKLETAKKMFWYTVIGTLLILGAWAITDAIVGTINSLAS